MPEDQNSSNKLSVEKVKNLLKNRELIVSLVALLFIPSLVVVFLVINSQFLSKDQDQMETKASNTQQVKDEVKDTTPKPVEEQKTQSSDKNTTKTNEISVESNLPSAVNRGVVIFGVRQKKTYR